MRQLTVQFTRPASGFKPVSGLIRVVQRTEFSHVRFTWTTSLGLPVVYEASGSAVKFLGPLAQAAKPVTVVDEFTLPLTEDSHRNLVHQCMYYSGVEYGKVQLLKMAWFLLTTRAPRGDGEVTQVCSELCGRILQGLGLGLADIDFDQFRPDQLHHWCKENL